MATETKAPEKEPAADAEGRQPLIRPLDEPSEQAEVLSPRPASVEAAADGKKLSAAETVDALDWLLSDDEEDASEYAYAMEIDIGPPDKEVWTKWVIRPLDADEFRAIQSAAISRAQRRRGITTDPDMTEHNMRIVVAGTVYPDLAQAAAVKGVADPSLVLKHRFRFKPLLLTQLAGEIIRLSGADDDAVRDSREVRAAGN